MSIQAQHQQSQITCPWCLQSAQVEPITDHRGYLGISHIVTCVCGLHASLDDVLSGNVGKRPKRADSFEGYRVAITSRRFYLKVYRPEWRAKRDGIHAYSVNLYHKDGRCLAACSCPGYVNSLAGRCRHTDLVYAWMRDPVNVDMCRKAWQIGAAA